VVANCYGKATQKRLEESPVNPNTVVTIVNKKNSNSNYGNYQVRMMQDKNGKPIGYSAYNPNTGNNILMKLEELSIFKASVENNLGYNIENTPNAVRVFLVDNCYNCIWIDRRFFQSFLSGFTIAISARTQILTLALINPCIILIVVVNKFLVSLSFYEIYAQNYGDDFSDYVEFASENYGDGNLADTNNNITITHFSGNITHA
jgi:hypothetical protein